MPNAGNAGHHTMARLIRTQVLYTRQGRYKYRDKGKFDERERRDLWKKNQRSIQYPGGWCPQPSRGAVIFGKGEFNIANNT